MLNTYQATHKAIEEAFRAGWKETTPVKYENRPFRPIDPQWVEIAVSWGSEIYNINTDWRNNQIGGVIYVEVHVPLKEGMDNASKLAGRVLDILAHKKFHHDNTLVTTFEGRVDSTQPNSQDFRLLCKCQFVGEVSGNYSA